MPAKPDKPYRMRIRVLDGKPREPKRLKGQLVPHVDVIDVQDGIEFAVCAVKEAHLDQVRAKLGAAGLEEVVGGDTTVPAVASLRPGDSQTTWHGGPHHRGESRQHREPQGRAIPKTTSARSLPPRPYGFVSLPSELKSAMPVWHDGTTSEGRLSGEMRFELTTLTPMLVGWERRVVGEDGDEPWPIPDTLDGVGQLAAKKSVLCPLRAPWGKHPVIIPGDSLKGLLRQELGALLGAPMERVAERSYSYRPNALFPKNPNPWLVPRLARVPEGGVEIRTLYGQQKVRVPKRLELLPANLKYDKGGKATAEYYRFDDGNGAPYRGGLGAGTMLNSKRSLHKRITINTSAATEDVEVPPVVQEGYLATLRHLVDLEYGHFSERHPDVPGTVTGDVARKRILEAAENEVFQPGDLIWVEWDTNKKCIVSLGWHYYYRWAYTDTVRRDADAPGHERYGLFPLAQERVCDSDGAPTELSLVRRLFGYTGDNEGSAGIGKDDYAQIMGRISVNAALEVVEEGDTEEQRFLPPIFLKELGMPRPSAVEFYLKQPDYPNPKGRADQAKLLTYGDAAGYDTSGELAGRKFYLDRGDAYSGEPWKDDSPANRTNERSTLAVEASGPGRRFRFTIRFRDLDATELAAIMVSLCPHQFRQVLQGNHPDGYCSKLGYARPLGWGTVRIETKALLLLEVADGKPALKAETDVLGWVKRNHQATATQVEWLAVHRHKHPDAADYPREGGQIHTYHTKLRAEHSRLRRYRRK